MALTPKFFNFFLKFFDKLNNFILFTCGCGWNAWDIWIGRKYLMHFNHIKSIVAARFCFLEKCYEIQWKKMKKNYFVILWSTMMVLKKKKKLKIFWCCYCGYNWNSVFYQGVRESCYMGYVVNWIRPVRV